MYVSNHILGIIHTVHTFLGGLKNKQTQVSEVEKNKV